MIEPIGPLLSGIFAVLFDRIAKRSFIEFFIKSGIDEQLLVRLKMLLFPMNEVLDQAEVNGLVDRNFKDWVDNLRAVICEVDILWDEILIEESQSRSLKDFNPLREGIKSKLEKMIYMMDEIVEQKEIIGLIKKFSSHPPIVPTTSLLEECEIYERENDKDKILKFVLSGNVMEEGRVPVVAIVGVAGIGKTTLAQLIYNDDQVRKHFSMKAWVYVSEGMDVSEITKKMYECITLSHSDSTDLNLLQLKIKAILRCKRFLIVLDNFSNDQFLDWNILKKPFSDSVHESRIIVTSRRSTVASALRSSLTHFPSYLSHEVCLMLFKKYAYTLSSAKTSILEEQMGEEIARKCYGLPILAQVLGSRLQFKDIAEWDLVLRSNVWDITCDTTSLLRLGHASLSSHVKRCFAYCSIFPRKFELEKWRLISLWMAEGLLPHPTETIENVGNKYISELVSMSYLRATENESCFIMPDIVYELAKHLAGEFSRSQVLVDNTGKLNVNVSTKIRYFSYSQGELIRINQLEAFDFDILSQLRTFLPFNDVRCDRGLTQYEVSIVESILPKLKRLRTLSLAHYPFRIFPDIIVCMQHLRYLDLSHTSITQLPSSIGILYNLETLLLFNCRNLTELPTSVCDLVNLHHLDIRDTGLLEMPDKLDNLQALQVLTTFFVRRHSGSNISVLGKLPNLHGSLSITNLQDVTAGCDAGAANLKNKQHLVSLEFKWTAVNPGTQNAMEMEEVVLLTLEPHKYLKTLKIDNFGGLSFPSWLRDSSTLCNLVYLELVDCKNCKSLPSLGQLPSLSKLHLTNFTSLKTVGPEFHGNEVKPFMSLTTLKFENMQIWGKWLPKEAGCGEFPSLIDLQFQNCPVLDEELPCFLNSSLTIVVFDCPKLQNLPARVPPSN